MSVKIADSIATKPVNGNFCHGFLAKQLDLNMPKESGKTCINAVAKMMPDAKALTITNRLRSGLRTGMERVIRGRDTPMRLVMNMAAIPIIFKGKALDLLLQGLLVSSSHCGKALVHIHARDIIKIENIFEFEAMEDDEVV
ncbi:hypothetical protein E3N88_31463 [Mikania micrantha]|uniref:Uncharacterized protein n=1 Tax=Mikania micrantha TaxID=192012 RepID=A0A5N6MQD1_9ASTR|nr:hypothetical protein E3N88_31463 [Mikania micrantha]